MREIKFRTFDEGELPDSMYLGYSGFEPAICRVYTIHLNKGTMRYKHPDLCDPIDAPIKNLMQFTGLTDKNGKEIYEGDILKITAFWDNELFYGCPVVFDEGMFGFKIKEYTTVNNVMDISAFITEVIGNIYENPELLESIDE